MAFLTRHRGFVRVRLVRTPRMTAFVRAPVTARLWVGGRVRAGARRKGDDRRGIYPIRMASPRTEGAEEQVILIGAFGAPTTDGTQAFGLCANRGREAVAPSEFSRSGECRVPHVVAPTGTREQAHAFHVRSQHGDTRSRAPSERHSVRANIPGFVGLIRGSVRRAPSGLRA
jgi:hypothetical protein